MARVKRLKKVGMQLTAFKETARLLDCNESEAAFDKALGKISRAAVPRKPVKRKRKPLKIALPDA